MYKVKVILGEFSNFLKEDFKVHALMYGQKIILN